MAGYPKATSHAGYHSFQSECGEYGSFEVFYADRFIVQEWNSGDRHMDEGDKYLTGWYWWACFPGCLPDSDSPNGPHNTSKQACIDAQDSAA